MIANYHTHTFRCGHAGTFADREYVEAAIKAGFTELGFSDHAPIMAPWDRPCMLPESLPSYVEDILKLKEEYADRIKIYLGFEAEYEPDGFEKFMDTVESYPFDYMILGQHDIFGEPKYVRTFWETEDESYFNTYCEQCAAALESGVYSYWAHPDIMHFVGDAALYEENMRKLCRKAKEQDVPLELNFTGMRIGAHYPNPDFWRIAGEEGNKVIYGCDAHAPNEVSDIEEYLKRACELTERFGLNVIDTLEIRKPSRKREIK